MAIHVCILADTVVNTVYDYGTDNPVQQAFSLVSAGVLFLLILGFLYKMASCTFVLKAGLLNVLM